MSAKRLRPNRRNSCVRNRDRARRPGRARKFSPMAPCCAICSSQLDGGRSGSRSASIRSSDYVAFAEFRGGAGALRQPHREWPVSDRRRRLSLERKPGDKHTLHGGPKGFGQRVWKLGAHDAASVELDARFARRRHGLSRRTDGDLRLPVRRAGDAAGRIFGGLRQADARQSDATRLFQPRRVARHSRPRVELLATFTRPPTPS